MSSWGGQIMKAKVVVILAILFLLNGCNLIKRTTLPLDFFPVNRFVISELSKDNITEIVQERHINSDISVLLFKNQDIDEISGAIKYNGEYFYIGQVSMNNTTEDLMGIDIVSVFGRKAVKIYGILGANYAQAYYWLYEDGLEDSIIRVDGHSKEIDLEGDGINEIISQLGTAPQTTIYIVNEKEVIASDINESINARAVFFQNIDEKIFEVFFKPNESELYFYQNGSLKELHR